MKNSATAMMKLIALLIVTPLLVLAYTKIERSLSIIAPVERSAINVVTPVTIGLMENMASQPTAPANNNQFLLVRYMGPSIALGEK